MASGCVLVERLEEVIGGVIGIVTLNRPSARNALTRNMLRDLTRALAELDKDETVRCVVLRGEGRAFCAGIDLTAASGVFTGDADDKEYDAVGALERLRVPIVGAVHGACVTAGFEIALACDVLVASEDAFFHDTHCKWGIAPGWGLSQKLPRMVGPNRARLASLACERIPARQALDWGLTTSVHATAELAFAEALRICKQICRNDALMVRHYKQVLQRGLSMTLSDGRKMELDEALKAYRKMDTDHFGKLKRFKSKL